jgi:murein DD-endopeptidase MepM/ murein hydrolase activator NlpD
VLLVLAAQVTARAQEPTPTIIVTTPTPTPPPGSQTTAEAIDGYTVRGGDTLLTAALEMGLDLTEMGCAIAPDFDESSPLVIGDLLTAPPLGVYCHRTAGGESTRTIAQTYGLPASALLAEPWNALPANVDAPLPAGRFVRVPGSGARGASSSDGALGAANAASPFLSWMLTQPANTSPLSAVGRGGVRRPLAAPVPADWPYGTGAFGWPTYGLLTQGYRLDHRALDIAAASGAPVTSADRGVVIRAGWNSQGYGNFVVVDHNIDYVTLYAHLDSIFVDVGDVVAAGQILGTVGQTGNATGPHLHFEIRDFGRLVNPIEMLAR